MTTQDLIAKCKRRPVATVSITASLVLAVFGYFRNSSIGELQAELDEATRTSNKLGTNVKNATSLQEQYDELVAANEKLKERMVKPDNLAINLQYFYKIESETGVKFLNILPQPIPTPSKGAKKGLFVYAPYTLTAEGSYRDLILLLKKIETGVRFCNITSATFSTAGGGESQRDPAGKQVLVLGLELLGES